MTERAPSRPSTDSASAASGRRRSAGTSRRDSARPGTALGVVPARRARRRLPFFLVAAAVLGVLVFGVVTLQAVVSQTSFQMQQLSHRNAQLQQRYGELQLQVAQLSAPARIAQEAHRLGLRLPDQVETISIPRARTAASGLPAAGKPSDAFRGELGQQP